jgi:hypothetical protein
MKMEYNDTDEYNSIRTGSTVYISGLPGKSYSFVNNRYGYVKEVLLLCENRKISYVAQIVLFAKGDSPEDIAYVNFDYIFRINTKFNDADVKAIIWEENPMIHYVFKKNLTEIEAIHDENGQSMAVCTDLYGRKHLLLCSGNN